MKEEDKGGFIIEFYLFIVSIGSLISSIIWIITTPSDHWLWFSRACLGVVGLGLYGILRRIRKNNEE